MLPQEESKSRRQRRLEEKADVTGKISDITRFIAFGLLVAFYTVNVSNDNFATGLRGYQCPLFLMGLCGSVAILLDYLQYVFGLLSVKNALVRETVDYDPHSLWYKGRTFCFVGKQVAVTIGSTMLVIIVALTVYKPIESTRFLSDTDAAYGTAPNTHHDGSGLAPLARQRNHGGLRCARHRSMDRAGDPVRRLPHRVFCQMGVPARSLHIGMA